ncbi:Transmembrane protein 19, partial [Stegodyphus mimosarum]
MMLVHLFSTVLSVTLLICLLRFSQQCYFEICENIHLERWMFSVAITLSVTGWGIRRRSLDWSGAVAAVFVGLILTFSSYCFMVCLLTFFYTSSKATHYCSEKKKKLEADYKE